MAGLLFAALTPGTAQTVSQRTQLEVFRDSIALVHDSTALIAAEKRLIGHAAHEARDSAMTHLELGFIALRLGDVAGHKHFEDAGSEFQWVVDLQPTWPYGWFGLGLAELGTGDAAISVLRGLQAALGKDALTRSANDFARSAEVDPSFVRGLVELSNTALRQRINLRLGVALAALRRAASTPAGSNPEVLLARARVEREVGSADSARIAINALVARQPASPTVLLEESRVLFALGDASGGEAWYRGLEHADTAALALYRADLLFVLPDSVLRAFDAATGPARGALMRRFWTLRDDDELHARGERLAEHYRRLEYARRNYRLASTHRHYDIVERYRPPVADFDDRGVVYIRQGTPDARASLELPGVPFNESWVYHRGDQPDLLFHFVAREGVTDFRLIESALDILGYASAVRLESTGDIQGRDAPMVQNFLNRARGISVDSAAHLRQRFSDAAMSRTAEAILRSRQPLNPVYSKLLGSGRGSASGLESDERTLGSRSIRLGTSSDSWRRAYAAELPARASVIAAGGDSATPRLHLVYAIPAGALGNGDHAPRIRASVLALDGRKAASIDTIDTGYRLVSTPAGDQLVGMLVLPVSGGRYTARVAVETRRAGVTSDRDTLLVAPRHGSMPGLSDVVLGSRDVPLFWITADGDTTWVNPVEVFRSSEPMQLYFEVSGIARDSSYRVEMTVSRPGSHSFLHRLSGIFGSSGAALRLAFTQPPSRADFTTVHRELVLQKLSPGRYVLDVTVLAAGGERATRHQEFTVVR